MLEEVALVVSSSSKTLLVETKTRSGCSHCSSNGDCGTSVLGKLFSAKTNQIQLDNTLGAKTGDKVIIGMPDELLVRAAILAYLIPLLMMILITIASSLAGATDVMQSVFALIGLALGLFLARQFTVNNSVKKNFTPRLLRMADQINISVDVLNH